MKTVMNGYKIFAYNKRVNMIPMISVLEDKYLVICF